jgi:LCP family protein required for cell wall assembly
VLAVIAVIVGWLLFLGGYVLVNLDKVDALNDYAGRPAATPGSTWLVVGSDSREGLTREQQALMLLHVSDSGRPTLVSLPRDSYVAIPGHGRNKLNAAFAFGGAPLLVRTVEQATGLRIDHYMEIGFAGVVGMTDAVGGVRVCLDKPIKDAKSGLDVPAGCQTMDGPTGLAYVRARYFDPQGDLGRVKRQQQYLGALIGKVASPATLINPVRQWRLVKAATAALTVDEGTGVLDLASFGWQMRKLAHGKGTETTVPVADPNFTTSAGSSVLWDRAKARALFASLKH